MASVLGAVCIALTLAAVLFDITLVMFKTGSMSPTIPAGSLAVVREIPASEARVGDIVTVDRPDQLPVTHRVVKTEPGPDGSAVLTLRGDANPVDDPAPYTVSTVRVVMASVPGLAFAVVFMSNPLALGTVTVVVASFITWYFWPRGGRPRRSRASHASH
ncbi:signal peptidase I [Agreia sp. COWG]|uniref:signal peptidase I n=1 Tax=Agreia sp. COWG TaxID=2773266 RepID=UPI001F01AB41|nr:signal peptidase I [Agreia sp. COWG]